MCSMRECYLKCDNRKALFHGWSHNSYIVAPSLMVGGHNGGNVSYTTAIVEMENGEVMEVKPNEIVFTGSPERKYDVAEERENRDVGAYEYIHNG